MRSIPFFRTSWFWLTVWTVFVILLPVAAILVTFGPITNRRDLDNAIDTIAILSMPIGISLLILWALGLVTICVIGIGRITIAAARGRYVPPGMALLAVLEIVYTMALVCGVILTVVNPQLAVLYASIVILALVACIVVWAVMNRALTSVYGSAG